VGRYALIDADNNVVNVCIWDGVSPWTPNPGLTAHEIPEDSPVGVGGTYDPKAKDYTEPDPPPVAPSTVDILQQLLIDKGVITVEDVTTAVLDATPVDQGSEVVVEEATQR
jgi:hypothetical protein